MDLQMCKLAFGNKWKDASGNFVYIPIGNLSDPHYNFCYRMFNVDREISRHRYQTLKTTAPLLPPNEWNNLANY